MEPNIAELTVAHRLTQLEKIGQGRCGTVWAVPCSDCIGHHHLAMKREDGSTGRSISHEYHMHQKLLRASLSSEIISFAIPQSFGYLSSQNGNAWSSILPRLPDDYTGCNAIVSEKIVSVPASIMRLLVREFRPDVDEESAINSQSNEHCLIRPYLGRRRYRRSETEQATGQSRQCLRAFSLRNFPLHLDQMEQLGIDGRDYAMAMADALAFLHWIARAGGNDVEFVLAQPRSQPNAEPFEMLPERRYCENVSILGPHTMWMLHFDLCRDLTLDKKGVEQASNAFWGNDPYYPRPGSSNTTDQRLWSIFEERFIESSAEALKTESDEIKELPRLLMERIKQAKATVSNMKTERVQIKVP
ncbi:zinc finger domain-containing protein [Trichoderma barbatum]